MHEKDRALLERLAYTLGVGKIYKESRDSVQYVVSSSKDLKVVIDYFDKYPLITQKLADYQLFKQAFELISNKEHLSTEGLKKLVAIKASMNQGLSDDLKAVFSDVVSAPRPVVVDQVIKDPHWVTGFTSGEGCFFIGIWDSSSHKLGSQVKLTVQITQSLRDQALMISLIEYLGCGKYYPVLKNNKGNFVVVKFSDITDKIIPFFNKYPLQGAKASDFADFCKVAEIIKEKGHLRVDGLEEIRKIKAGMNRGRSVIQGS